MTEIKWNWQGSMIEKWLDTRKNHPELYDDEFDYIGCVRAGDLCFDLVEREFGSDGLYLTADLYVGGIDSGYGYGVNGYPYDYFDEVTFSWESEKIATLGMEEFKEFVGQKLTELVNEHDKDDPECSLLEKAAAPEVDW